MKNINNLSFPKFVIGNLNLRKTKEAEVPDNDVRVRPYNSAFTLIELLVVVLIIGILSAIALPQYQKAVAKSKYALLKPLVRAIADAEEVYYLANQSYAEDFVDLDISMPTPTSISTTGRVTYYYPWGECFIYNKSLIECINSSAKLRYGIFLKNTNNSNKGKQICEVNNDNSIAHQICKSDSGLATHTGGATDNGNYEYTW